jgi:hypothetical protein
MQLKLFEWSKMNKDLINLAILDWIVTTLMSLLPIFCTFLGLLFFWNDLIVNQSCLKKFSEKKNMTVKIVKLFVVIHIFKLFWRVLNDLTDFQNILIMRYLSEIFTGKLLIWNLKVLFNGWCCKWRRWTMIMLKYAISRQCIRKLCY